MDVVKAIVERIDKPDTDYSINRGPLIIFVREFYFCFFRNSRRIYAESDGVQS